MDLSEDMELLHARPCESIKTRRFFLCEKQARGHRSGAYWPTGMAAHNVHVSSKELTKTYWLGASVQPHKGLRDPKNSYNSLQIEFSVGSKDGLRDHSRIKVMCKSACPRPLSDEVLQQNNPPNKERLMKRLVLNSVHLLPNLPVSLSERNWSRPLGPT